MKDSEPPSKKRRSEPEFDNVREGAQQNEPNVQDKECEMAEAIGLEGELKNEACDKDESARETLSPGHSET